jgi:hypothetical protein
MLGKYTKERGSLRLCPFRCHLKKQPVWALLRNDDQA